MWEAPFMTPPHGCHAGRLLSRAVDSLQDAHPPAGDCLLVPTPSLSLWCADAWSASGPPHGRNLEDPLRCLSLTKDASPRSPTQCRLQATCRAAHVLGAPPRSTTPWDGGSFRARLSARALPVWRSRAEMPPRTVWVELLFASVIAVAIWLILAYVTPLSMQGTD